MQDDGFEPDGFEADDDGFEADGFQADAATESYLRRPSAMGAATLAVGKASRGLDRVAGAPVRQAVSRLQDGKLPNLDYNYEDVPEWKDIYSKAGVSDKKSIQAPWALNPWDSEAKMSPSEVLGGVTGAAADPLNYLPIPGAKAVQMGSKALDRTAQGLKGFAERRAAKSAMGQNLSAYRQTAGMTSRGLPDTDKALGRIQDLGRTMIDDGSVGWFSSTEGVGKKASKAYEDLGGQIGRVGKAIDAYAPDGVVSGDVIAERIFQFASEIPPNEAGKAIQERLLKEADNFIGKRLTFEEAQKFKSAFKFSPQDADRLISSQDATNAIRRIINEEMEAGVKSVSQSIEGDPFSGYRDLKKRYGHNKTVAQAATDRTVKDLNNRVVSPSDYGMGIGSGAGYAATTGDPATGFLVGAGLGAANNFARKRGSAFAAKSADALRKVIGARPKVFEKWGPQLYAASQAGTTSLVVTHHLLMQSDPEYREAIIRSGGL
jgi:hypothetical protein